MLERAKVRVPLGDGPAAGETLWAEFVGGQRYRLANALFYAEGLAEGDIVWCEAREGWLTVLALDEDGGNDNVRILLADDADTAEVEAVLGELTAVGCTFERASPRWLAVTVPVTLAVSFAQLSAYLNATADQVAEGWEMGKWPSAAPAHPEAT